MKRFALILSIAICFAFFLSSCEKAIIQQQSVGSSSSVAMSSSTSSESSSSDEIASTSILPSDSSSESSISSASISESLSNEIKNKSVAVMIVIDASSAMCGGKGASDIGLVNPTGLQYVREALIASLYGSNFSVEDYIGVIYFGGKGEPIVALDVTSLSNIFDIEIALNMTSFYGKPYMENTEWRSPMESAAARLNNFNATANKHMLFITEGAGAEVAGESPANSYPVGGWKVYGASLNSGDLNNKCYTGYMYDYYGIKTTTVNIINNLQPAASYIEKMAADGEGSYNYAMHAEQITETVSAAMRSITNRS